MTESSSRILRSPWSADGADRTVLVAEDEPLVRSFLAQGLGALGFHVQAAADGAAAWDLFRAEPSAIDLLITDLTMPKLTGHELLQHILPARLDLVAIVCSGDPRELAEVGRRWPNRVFLLNKPFALEELREALRAVTGRQLRAQREAPAQPAA